MSEDYLKNTREKSLVDDSKISEAELHATHDNIREGWQELQDLRRAYANAKQAASKEVDLEYLDRIKECEGNYAMLLTLTR